MQKNGLSIDGLPYQPLSPTWYRVQSLFLRPCGNIMLSICLLSRFPTDEPVIPACQSVLVTRCKPQLKSIRNTRQNDDCIWERISNCWKKTSWILPDSLKYQALPNMKVFSCSRTSLNETSHCPLVPAVDESTHCHVSSVSDSVNASTFHPPFLSPRWKFRSESDNLSSSVLSFVQGYISLLC